MLLEYLYITSKKYIWMNAMIYVILGGLLFGDMVYTSNRDTDESALSGTMYATMVYTCLVMLREITHAL